MQVNIKKLHPNAKVPTYATDGSTAFDLYALTVNGSHQLRSLVTEGYPVLCDTGIAFELPPGYGMFILSRSGQGQDHHHRQARRGDAGVHPGRPVGGAPAPAASKAAETCKP